MKIQKGMVKYKDRNDIICLYGVTEDGRTYYFLDNTDEKTFSNGNRVASTELVEAIDSMAKASKVGVVDANGNEIIACENKSVKQILDDVVLVEKAVPTTESVLTAINNRNDSLYAAQLVSTPAQIKDNIYKQMGTEGRFILNDQFSEATICDINGNNLVNGEVYSFVAVNNNVLYLSKNLPDSPVELLSLGKENEVTVVEENVDTNSVVEPVETVVENELAEEQVVDVAPIAPPAEEVQETVVDVQTNEEIDVNNINVPVDVIENALEEQDLVPGNNVIQDNFETDIHTPLDNVNEGLTLPSTDDFLAATSLGAGLPIVEEDNSNTVQNEEVPSENDVENVEVNTTEEVVAAPVVEETEVNEVETTEEETVVTDEVVEENATEEVVENEVVEENTIEETVENEVPPIDDIVVPEDAVEEEIVNHIIGEDETIVNEEENLKEETVVEEKVEEVVSDNHEIVEEPEEFTMAENISDVFEEEQIEEPVEEHYDVVDEKTSTLDESDIQSLFEKTSLDLFNGGPLQIDSIVNDGDDLDGYTFSFKEKRAPENLFDDLAKSMTALIKQNREQRATIANYESVIKGLNSTKMELRAKVTEQEHKNVELCDRNRSLENAIIKLKTRIEMLTAKIREKDDRIAKQTVELERLRPQLEGRDQLIGLLRDAQALIHDDREIDDIDDYSYSKAA